MEKICPNCGHTAHIWIYKAPRTIGYICYVCGWRGEPFTVETEEE